MSEAADATMEVVESLGVKIPIDPAIVSEHIQKVIRAGEYEKAEAKNLYRIVEDGERLVELGGGIGLLSTLVGLLGRAETIVTVEANPQLIPLIRATHRLNEVTVEVIHGAAVGDETTATVPFSLEADFWASSLAPRKRDRVVGVVEVPAVSLRSLVKTYRPTMLIIDVEGTEGELLQHASDLDGVRKVMIEVHEKALRPVGVKRLFDFFSAAGFYVDVGMSVFGVILFRRLEQG